MTDSDFQVFISYARPDQEKALELYEWLDEHGFRPWIDLKKLKGGQNWDFEIRREIDKSSIILILWSRNSKDRRGYIQKEVKIALDKLKEKLVDDIYIIPIILDDFDEFPEQLKEIQFISEKSPKYKSEVGDAISHQMERLGAKIQHMQEQEELFWKVKKIKEEWDGIPGYSVEIDLFDFTSKKYKNSEQISDYIRGKFLEDFFSFRTHKLNQYPTIYSYVQDKWSRTHTLDAYCSGPTVFGKVISLKYAINWYGAGAAHPNHGHVTFNFLLDPLIKISSLEETFQNSENAFSVLQAEVRRQLKGLFGVHMENGELDDFQVQHINDGTASWTDFSAFAFTK